MKNERVLFLDIDGVLNTTRSATHIRLDEERVLRLKRVLDQTGAYIVLSTFWRNFDDYIAYILSRYGVKERVIGATPGATHHSKKSERSSADEAEYASRASEIHAWLREHPVSSYVILDDRLTASLSKERFVHTKTALGLTDADADEAIRILCDESLPL